MVKDTQRIINFLLAMILANLISICTTALAQQAGAGMAISVQETFKPTFRVEPLVQRFSGRRGEVIPFRFLVESSSRDAEIEVIPIALKQDVDGKVLHVEDAGSDHILQLTTVGRQVVQRDVPYHIEGLIRIPGGNTDFYSLGIMVRELGQAQRSEEAPAAARDQTKAGLKFITQYIVRIDLNVEGVPGEGASAIQFSEVKIASVNGVPKLFAYFKNDSASAFEFSVNARLYGSPSDRSFKRMKLVMPVRETFTDDTRYVGRLFPKTTVRMGALIEESIPTGDYNVDLELIVNSRIVQRRTFPVKVDSKSFPAQEMKASSVGERLYLSPGQVELSQVRGGQRRVTFEFANSLDKAQTIEIQPRNAQGDLISDLLIQPSTFTLAPNARRRISASLKSVPNSEVISKFGSITVLSKVDGEEFQRTGQVPLAIIFNSPPPPKLQLETLRWVMTEEGQGFRTTVHNTGDSHVAVNAKLSIMSEAGQRWTVFAGFGKWIMPGQDLELEFPLQQPLPLGNFQLICEIPTSADLVKVKQLIQVGEANGLPVSSEK